MPIPSFVLEFERTAVVREQHAPEMERLVITRGERAPDGTPLTETSIDTRFMVADADGRYRSDVPAKQWHMQDHLDAHVLELRTYGVVARAALLAAVVPDVEPFKSMGIGGKPFIVAGPMLQARYEALLAQELALTRPGDG